MKKNISNIRSYFLIILLGIGIGLIINFAMNNFYSKNTVENSQSQKVDLSLDPNADLGFDGIRVLALKDVNKLNDQFTLNLNDEGDFRYTFKILNNTDKAHNIALTFYLDYKQITFKSNDKQYTTYKFHIDKNSKMNIPVEFRAKKLLNSSHILSLHIKSNYDKNYFYSDSASLENTFEFQCRYNLTKDITNQIKEPIQISDYDKAIDLKKYIGIKLNTEIYSKDLFKYPSLITATPNEKVLVPIAFGGFKDIENYVVWLTINNQQIQLPNKEYFMNFKVPKGNGIVKYLEIEVPNTKGIYELQAHLSVNPWCLKDSSISTSLNTESSNQITLKVE